MVDADGEVTQVGCIIFLKVEKRDKFHVPKIDGLWKHAGRKRAKKDMVVKKRRVKVGSFYFNGRTAHERNEKDILSRPLDSIAN